MDIVIKNARIVAASGIVAGSVKVVGGVIESVDQGPCMAPGGVDFQGDYLLPGFVELHTDNLEQELEPRPGVFWPDTLSSVLAHDAQMVSAGITTVLDAVSLGEYHDGPKRSTILDMSIRALRKARSTGVLKADHKLHLRCEYSDPKVLEMLAPHLDDDVLMLVSLMDHTPGQRQFTDTDKYRQYYKNRWNDEEFAEMADRLVATQRACAAENRRVIVELCRQRAIPMASHDDTTAEHIGEAVREKIAISEFPTTRLAASLARQAGISIVMGGPNVVRGGSHSGNVAAQDLAAVGLLDILSSDYVPGSLASGAFALHRRLGIPLHETVAMISLNPATVIGLLDRGEIAPGKRADLVRVREIEGVPAVLQTWAGGTASPLEITAKNAA
ncbi:MAG: alpha-D-ribose 1-methylphosphonate 5-triphosphate diphosphatase [Pseudodesulfovibrio sp.]|uniref:Phosphonate metabolism protein PhnM n=1 Tax=Pseudodesulfovibrio aespoeensis (strain ATCC 700646 / DSM 10631 / Aspo-2) TaxID=643562 RepID=E6VTK7_PSEA9|nr:MULTISPECIES: alpha-D-ribose 1-methylphosphonate 5-triphosphate diphosphatase [Pseudodesulfovibrio]MBU4244767.1 alpha-D-ribose 1-methylphosphonate 5-triphosphate diphosphatase [Pseudomonadota bacterium]ADU62184.1 phosphonate metabolism protein PhnM [Pseudodesulfovibrio aespoeensis Aspo-2]MBU4379668.1 alpha-D-ribose 1-methylphosphonate 5-triphosphate diphosphatase [Pseudomonadota bacterium]MBU4476127.1 alpha-D-ribose 1-methylphosphonate 5-triphosphate diphosphatase [Pseudomonadota bacterium]